MLNILIISINFFCLLSGLEHSVPSMQERRDYQEDNQTINTILNLNETNPIVISNQFKHLEKVKSLFHYKKIILGLIMFYCFRKKAFQYYEVLRKSLELTNFDKGFLVVIGGLWTIILKSNYSIKDSTDKDQDPDLSQTLNEDRVKVLNVLKQNGLDCGYHAIKNGVYVYQMVNNQISMQDVQKLLITTKEQYFPIEQWRDNILRKYRNKLGVGDNLSDEEINHIISFWPQAHKIPYSIFQNILEENSIGIEDALIEVIDSFKVSSEKIHLFILGTMNHVEINESEISTKYSGTSGHWISIVATKKNNKIQYYAMDSLSGITIKPLVRRLKKLLEEEDINKLKLISKVGPILSSAKEILNNKELRMSDAEKPIRFAELIQKAQKAIDESSADLIDKALYKKEIEDLIEFIPK